MVEVPDLVKRNEAMRVDECRSAAYALKALAGMRDNLYLISPVVLDPIQHLKVDHLGNRNPRLHTDETLIALSI